MSNAFVQYEELFLISARL